MKWLNRVSQISLLVVIGSVFPRAGLSTPVTLTNGTMSVSGGQLFATNEFKTGNFSISYDVVQDGDQVTYTYQLFVPLKSLSHWNLMVSPTFTSNDLISFSASIPTTLDTPNPKTYHPNGSSQEGMPGDLFGYKFVPDSAATRTGLLTFVLVTDRLPTNGNFYARDGSGVYTYNTGFSDPATGAFLPVPDTFALPEPSSLTMAAGGLMLLVKVLRRRR